MDDPASLLLAGKGMTRCALLVLAVMLAAMAPVAVQSVSRSQRWYQCDGVSPDGKSYRAAVHIVRNGDTYVVKWLTPRGVVNVGVGFVSGQHAVGWICRRLSRRSRVSPRWRPPDWHLDRYRRERARLQGNADEAGGGRKILRCRKAGRSSKDVATRLRARPARRPALCSVRRLP